MRDKRIFITGGAGYLGSNIIKRYYDDNEITVYSRDEAKHYYLKKEFPKVNCIIGDVRNFDLLKRAPKVKTNYSNILWNNGIADSNGLRKDEVLPRDASTVQKIIAGARPEKIILFGSFSTSCFFTVIILLSWCGLGFSC